MDSPSESANLTPAGFLKDDPEQTGNVSLLCHSIERVDTSYGDLSPVVADKNFRGTHQGEFMGVAPTGRQVEFAVIDILRLDQGKVVEHWAVQDRLALMQQMGLLSVAGQG